MPTNNPWLTPYQRSYNDIKAKLISGLKARVPEITDFSEGNIFILIIGIFAAIAEVIHYYIDNMAREAFLPTARRYSSLMKHAKLVDYHIKAAYPSSVDLTLYRSNGKSLESNILIQANTVFESTDGKKWLVSKDILWEKGTYSIKVPVIQKELVGEPNRISFGNITSQNAVIYLGTLPTDKKYVEGSMVLYIGGELWTLVDTFAYAGPLDKVYKVELDSELEPYITFGDGRFGMKPDLNLAVEGSYYLTYGSKGNIPENSFTSVPQELLDYANDLMVMNTYAAAGGTNYETFDMLKDHIPLSVKTLGVAITKEDFEAIAKLVPGVDKAYVDYICGKSVIIYITPDNGGEASEALLDETEKRISQSKVITTYIEVKSTHQALIYIEATIQGRKSFSKIDITDQVKKALVEAYSYQTSDINKVVRLSDLYALIDNQSMVDYLSIDGLYLLPYPQVVRSTGKPENSPALNITYFKQSKFIEFGGMVNESFIIEITDSGYKIIDHNMGDHTGSYGTPLTVNTDNSGFTITIGELNGGLKYNVGDQYSLILQPMNRDITPHDFNIPIFKTNTITLTVNEVV